MSIFGSFGYKVHLSSYKGCEEGFFSLFFQLVRFDFLKLILGDAIVDLK